MTFTMIFKSSMFLRICNTYPSDVAACDVCYDRDTTTAPPHAKHDTTQRRNFLFT